MNCSWYTSILIFVNYLSRCLLKVDAGTWPGIEGKSENNAGDLYTAGLPHLVRTIDRYM